MAGVLLVQFLSSLLLAIGMDVQTQLIVRGWSSSDLSRCTVSPNAGHDLSRAGLTLLFSATLGGATR